jgi:DNA polymerase-3 subunit beta
MKITLSRDTLFELLSDVAGAVEKKHTTPILENVLVRATESELVLVATDLEIEMSAEAPMKAEEPGEITVPARKFLDICKAMPADSVINLSVNENQRLIMQGLRSRFELSTLPASDFPLLDDLQFDNHLALTEEALKSLFEKTSFAMANQDVRYYLNGLLLDIGDASLATVATDGHRLAISKQQNLETNTVGSQQIIVPRKGILELSRLLSGNDGKIDLQISQNHIRVQTKNVQFTSKLIDGRYPDYAAAIPASAKHSLQLDRLQFRDTLQRVSILSNEKFKGVRLTLSEGVMTIESNNPERESAEEEIDINYADESFEIGFNVTYLLEAVNHIKGGTVSFDLTSPESSALLYDPEDETTRYVVMPIRL